MNQTNSSTSTEIFSQDQISQDSMEALILNKFYTEMLGLYPYKSILYNSLNSHIYLDDNPIEIYDQISSLSNKIFSLQSFSPDENKNFSDTYCEMVKLLKNSYRPDESKALQRNDITTKIAELEEKLKNTTSGIRKNFYNFQKTRLQKRLDRLDTSYTKSVIDSAEKSCINLKIALQYSIEDIKNSFMGKNVSDSYEYRSQITIHEDNTQKPETYNVKVSFGKVIRIPIHIDYHQEALYRLSAGKEILLPTNQDYSGYTDFCVKPTKIILGIKPNILYSKENEAHAYSISDNHAAILGYEVNRELCRSTLLTEFAKQDASHNAQNEVVGENLSDSQFT